MQSFRVRVTAAGPISRPGGPAVSPSRSVPRSSRGRLSALRVCVLAADKKEHYGSREGPSSRSVQPPFTLRNWNVCRSEAILLNWESARSSECDPRLREGSPVLIVRLTSKLVRGYLRAADGRSGEPGGPPFRYAPGYAPSPASRLCVEWRGSVGLRRDPRRRVDTGSRHDGPVSRGGAPSRRSCDRDAAGASPPAARRALRPPVRARRRRSSPRSRRVLRRRRPVGPRPWTARCRR